jgi:branched-chain amino acid aminotransferase
MFQKFDERNRNLIVNISGKLVHRDQAGVSPFDSAVQGGDAVWEGLRLYDGRIFALDEHLARLRSSAIALAFDGIPENEAIVKEIRRTLEANKMKDGVHIRLTLTRGVKITSGMDQRLNQSGPTLIVLAEHKAPVYSRRASVSLRAASAARRPTASTRRSTTRTCSLDPRQDPGECRGCGRRGHARRPRVHRRDECDAPFHGA